MLISQDVIANTLREIGVLFEPLVVCHIWATIYEISILKNISSKEGRLHMSRAILFYCPYCTNTCNIYWQNFIHKTMDI